MQKDETTGRVIQDDLSGRVFGSSIVLNQWKRTGNGGTKWLVQCQCPNRTEWWVWAELIKRSPGLKCRKCRNAETAVRMRENGQRYLKTTWPNQKGKQIKTYRAWQGAKQRVFNPKAPTWAAYGGRGITMCSGWADSYETFLKDLGHAPFPHWSLGRIENDGNYSCGHCSECKEKSWPLNVRWENANQQNNNRRHNAFITFNGKTQTVTQWAVELGISPYAIRARTRMHHPLTSVMFSPNSKPGEMFFSHNL